MEDSFQTSMGRIFGEREAEVMNFNRRLRTISFWSELPNMSSPLAAWGHLYVLHCLSGGELCAPAGLVQWGFS